MEITSKQVSYSEIINGVEIGRDDYGLIAALTDTRKKTLFANPNLTDLEQPLLNLKLVDGVVAGRGMIYPTKFKIEDALLSTKIR